MRSRHATTSLLWLLFTIHVSAEIHRMVELFPSAFEPHLGLANRQELLCPASTETVCPDGNGCCSSGAACYTSNGVGLCSQPCEAAAVTCSINNVIACCDVGQECNPSGCIAAAGSRVSITTPIASLSTTGPTPVNTRTATATAPTITTPTSTSLAPTGTGMSLTCGTDLACTQGTDMWCCLPTLACDYSSPGFCLETNTFGAGSSSQQVTLPTSEEATISSTSSAKPAVFTAAAASSGNFEFDDWGMRVIMVVVAVGFARLL